MRKITSLFVLALLLLFTNCGDDGGSGLTVQSNKCNDGDQATLSLNINGVGSFTFTDSERAISHATDTEGSGVDAIVMYMRWLDPVTGDSIIFDITVENSTLAATTYIYNPMSFNGTVNFYIHDGGVLQSHYTFSEWVTSINEFEVFTTSSGGGFTNTKLAYVSASTSGTLTKVGAGTTHAFSSDYTICPKY